jgi:MFS family permease
LLTLLQPWIASAGFPGDDLAGWCGALGFIGGMVATFVAAPLLDHTCAYNQAVRWSFLVAFLVMVGVIFVLQPNSKEWVLITAFFLMGMSQFPLLPICLDAAAAHTYPISEELSSAGLQFVGQYLGIAMTDGMEYLLKHQSIIDGGNPVAFAAPLNIAILALMLFSAVVAFLYSGEDRRAVSGEELRSSHGHRADEEG